jgi:EmrB/QacA subfamily drug resistance transporter
VRRASLSAQQIVGAVYVSAMFMSIMDSTIVNVALPALAHQFSVLAPQTDGVVVGYLVSLAVWIPASGWIGDRFGTKRTFLFALGLFTVASFACGFSQSLLQLVVSRIVQGVGGGMLTPVGMAMLYRAFPPEQRAKAARVLVIPTVMAPALGPIVGGALIVHLSWRWVFFVNVPIGIGAFIFGALMLSEVRARAQERFDVPGFVLAAAGFGSLLFALTEAASVGWGSPEIIVTGVAGVLLVVALVLFELRQRLPMVDFRLLAHRLFGVINLASLFGASGFIGLLFIATIYLQAGRGFDAFTAGSSTAPEALGVLCASQLVGRIYPRVGPRRLMCGGMALVAAGTVVLAGVMTDDLWIFRAVMFVIGVGWSFVVIPMNAGAFAQVSPRDTGRASALYNAQRQLASALGVATLATLVGTQLASGADIAGNVGVFREAFFAAAGFALAGSLVALGIRDRDAAATMRRRGSAASAPAA